MKIISRSIYQAFGLLLASFALLPQLQAVVPLPDGGYPNFTTAEGDHALQALTTGVANTAIGTFSLFSVTTGNFNTAVGAGSLDLNLGDFNTATGAAALLFNTTGIQNTAVGTAALEFNEIGRDNTANGAFALFSNTTGSRNTVIGSTTLFSNTTGNDNTATGFQALSNNNGSRNTANGSKALASNTIGSDNTAIGIQALFSNTTGNNNTAFGVNALLDNTTGAANIALGNNAGSSLTTGNGNIDIGNIGNAAEANTIRIGEQVTQTATFIAGISGATVKGTAVVVNGSGQLGVAPSSARFKDEIKPMDNRSEAIHALKPVTFRYKKEIDAERTPQFGLIAEDVEKVNPDLVVRDQKGKPYTVRYEAVNAMLLNEFLKEHRKVEKLEATVERQHKDFEAAVAELKGQIQKVSAQLELNKAAPQTVKNTE